MNMQKDNLISFKSYFKGMSEHCSISAASSSLNFANYQMPEKASVGW